jgi:hypothetical protein
LAPTEEDVAARLAEGGLQGAINPQGGPDPGDGPGADEQGHDG